MEEVLKAIEALTESLKPVVAFVNESAKKADESKPEVDAEALDSARAEGAKAAAESLKAIDDAKLPEKIAEAFKAKVLAGEDVTEAVASAKTIADAVIESAVEDGETKVHVIESAERGSGKKDWSY
jgi:3-hydroxyacyl-CoA dehydrogenase